VKGEFFSANLDVHRRFLLEMTKKFTKQFAFFDRLQIALHVTSLSKAGEDKNEYSKKFSISRNR